MGELNSAATFLRLDTPLTQQLKQHRDTLSAMYLPQLMTPQRRHIHGLFVDLQPRTQKLSQNSEVFRNTGKGETKRAESENRVTNRPSSTGKPYLSTSTVPVFHGVSFE